MKQLLTVATIAAISMFYAVPCSAQDTTAWSGLSLRYVMNYTEVTDTVFYERIIWIDSLGLKVNSGYVIQKKKVPTTSYLYSEKKLLKVTLLNGREIRPEELLMMEQKVSRAWEWH